MTGWVVASFGGPAFAGGVKSGDTTPASFHHHRRADPRLDRILLLSRIRRGICDSWRNLKRVHAGRRKRTADLTNARFSLYTDSIRKIGFSPRLSLFARPLNFVLTPGPAFSALDRKRNAAGCRTFTI